MPEYGTTTPTAGWYTDPANATLERWWGGVEWTHDTRPIAVIAAPEPAFAAVPGGGTNPFAVEAAPSWGTSTTPLTHAQGVGNYYADVVVTGPPKVAAGWYDQGRIAQAQPANNPAATRALVFGILTWVFNPLFIFTILALTSAKRGLENAQMFEYERREPIGRTMSKWGRGLAVGALILSLVSAGFGVWLATAGNAFLSDALRAQISSLTSGTPGDSLVPDASQARPIEIAGAYDRAAFEQGTLDQYTNEGFPPPNSVSCPDEASTADGEQVICSIEVDEGTQFLVWVYNDGTATAIPWDAG